MLALAEQYHCDLLKEACIEFISSSSKVILDLESKHSCVTGDALAASNISSEKRRKKSMSRNQNKRIIRK